MRTEEDPGFEALLEHLRRCRGFTFSGFKRASLIRRVADRLRVAGVGNCAEYRTFLAEAQGRILTRFHAALAEAGYLFLGKAELILTHTHLFHSVNLTHHVFTKVAADAHPGGPGGPDLDRTDPVQDREAYKTRRSWDAPARHPRIMEEAGR